MEIDLSDYHKSILSQFGQDGILEKIYEVIGTSNKYFVEFGSNGKKTGGGNTPYLREFGFDGILLDGYEAPYGEKHERDYPVQIEFISAENINSIFEKYNVPHEFDLLSIDIDGQDFHVWNSIHSKYKPRVVVIESNHGMFPNLDLVMKYDTQYVWDGTHKHGASIQALQKLGNKKGYDLVAYTGADGIFVRHDIIVEKNIHFIHSNQSEALWHINFQLGYLNKYEHVQCQFDDKQFFFPSATFL